MAAINVWVWVPCVPMRMVLASAATPWLPISILLSPVVRFRPAPRPKPMLLVPVVLLKSACKTVGRVVIALGVVQEGPAPVATLESRSCFVRARLYRWPLKLPTVLFKSAAEPVAVLSRPVLFKSASQPTAVLLLSSLLLKSAKKPMAVLPLPSSFEASALSPLAVLKLPSVLLWSAL